MKHQKYQEWIELALYGELEENRLSELNEHLLSCPECSAEYKSQEKFYNFLSAHKPPVSSRLLEEARFELQGALRAERNRVTFLDKLKEKISQFFEGKLSIVAASMATLIIGLFAGYLLFNSPEVNNRIPDDARADSFIGSNVKISNIKFIDQGNPDGEIEFQFEAVKPVRMRGNISDPEIQNVLMYAILNEENPGVRLNSLNVLSKQSEAPNVDKDVRDALIMVIKYDENPGVRREALQLLKKYKYDTELKETFLYVLMNDSISGIRIEAINGLKRAKEEGVVFNEDARDILRERMTRDENNYVRFQARTVLEELTEQ
jgi:hypothetical protein